MQVVNYFTNKGTIIVTGLLSKDNELTFKENTQFNPCSPSTQLANNQIGIPNYKIYPTEETSEFR